MAGIGSVRAAGCGDAGCEVDAPSDGAPPSRPGAGGAALSLDRDEALRYLGYADQKLDAQLLARFEELASACERELRPACASASFPVDEALTRWGGEGGENGEGDEGPQVVLAGCGLVLPGRDIARHLRGAREVALLACTLGAACERELRKHAAISPTDALLYGAAASALVEAAADACDAAVASQAAARGLRASARYSPGYGDLPLSVQPAFLKALDATRRIGLSVTAGNLLVPTKSVTAVIGLFDEARADGGGSSGARDANRGGARDGASGRAPVRAHADCATCPAREGCLLKGKGRTCHG